MQRAGMTLWRTCGPSQRSKKLSRSRVSLHADARVNHETTLAGWQGEDRIEIEFTDFGNVFDHPGHPEQHGLDRVDVGGWMSAVSFQKTIAADLPNHLFCVPIRKRCYAKTNIGQHLDMNAAESKGDEWSKRSIFRNTNHHFHSVQHLLDQDSFHPFLFDLVEDAPDTIFVLQIQSNCANIGLM